MLLPGMRRPAALEEYTLRNSEMDCIRWAVCITLGSVNPSGKRMIRDFSEKSDQMVTVRPPSRMKTGLEDAAKADGKSLTAFLLVHGQAAADRVLAPRE